MAGCQARKLGQDVEAREHDSIDTVLVNIRFRAGTESQLYSGLCDLRQLNVPKESLICLSIK